MLVREWMTEDLIVVKEDTSMLKASKLLKEHDIRRLPVVNEEGRLVGIVSDRDIKDASPSKATTLEIHELHYLISEIKIRDIMTRDPLTVLSTDTVERAAQILEEKGYGSLPVVNSEDQLVGIITDHDIYKIYIEITGARYGGVQIALMFKDVPGALIPFLNLLHSYNANIVTLLSTECPDDMDCRRTYVHLRPMERNIENELIEKVKAEFNVQYWVREKLFEE